MDTKEIEYKDGDVTCRAFVAIPEGSGPFPCVLVAHAWNGRDEFVCDKARLLAERGCVGFALDVYGDARLGGSVEENQALMTPFAEDRAMLRQRLLAAVGAAQSLPAVDAARMAAIGYCFGGLCALDLARAGADVLGVVSFHGLFTGTEHAGDRIKAKVLALHGHEDPMVPPEAVLEFEQEMTAAGADWQVHAYGNTYHAFTNPQANDVSFGTVYHPDMDRRSWKSMNDFLDELFG